MSGRSQRDSMVSLVVYEDTKQEWKDAVEDDPHADSLSQFIRVAVSRYLHEKSGGVNGDLAEEIHHQLSELQNQQTTVKRQFDELKGQLSDIRDAVIGSDVSPETKELAQDILDLLPTEKEIRTNPVLEDSSGVPAPAEGSVEWLSDQLDVHRYQIQTALTYLDERTFGVSQTPSGEQYYKGGGY